MRKITLLLFVLALCTAALAEVPKSWHTLGMDAIMKGDYKTGAAYLKKWVEADPSDAVAWYNLACCFAVEKKTNDAMKALKKAAEAGWSDAAHTSEDDDLKSLREHKDFAQIIRDIAHNASSRNGGFTINLCKQERLGEYIVILPDEYDGTRRYPLVVLLHGYGDSMRGFTMAAPMISSHDYIFIIPEAAYPLLEGYNTGFSHLREFDNFKEDTASIPSAAQWVVNAADDAMKRYPIDGNKFWMAGFSQGAAVAHIVAARFPDRVAGYAAHGGYLIKGEFSEEQFQQEKQRGVSVLITHGKEDPAVPIMEGVYAANLFQRVGVDVQFEQMDVKHEFTAEVGAKIDEWMKDKLKTKK
jgi:predicted esterase